MTQNDDIQALLDRFMSGQTSEAEEERLAHYFRTAGDVPGEWQAYRELFASFDTDLYAFSEQELDAMATPVPTVEQKMPVALRRPSWTRRALRVAASAALVAGVGLVGYKGLVAPAPVAAPSSQPKSVAQVVQAPKGPTIQDPSASDREQQPASLRKAPADGAMSSETVTEKAAEATWKTAELPTPQTDEANTPSVAVASSCGSYAEADYAEFLSQFASLREYIQADCGDDAQLVASTSNKPSVSAPDTFETQPSASTGSPFDGEVVFSRMPRSFPAMQ